MFFPRQVLQEEVLIPGSDLKMTYLSSRASGYKPVLKVAMTQSSVPFNLMKVRRRLKIFLKPCDTQKNNKKTRPGFLQVHLMVAVVGRLFQKWFPAQPNLSYTYIWDKTDAYGQRVYGLSEAVGESIQVFN